ncbi:hypothetical protein IGI04_023050 [Brassica rapa subsp. trilocularis]|uniref:Uncharacterized protein n=1 Tax=Brassica rapa subsp. trilocularis TaxID=1813537 RepID=A0ABQ7M3B0_BRACM|nr:hypothetical protein IGI04_023050 [Brassica rapa subsp. trilocularis]
MESSAAASSESLLQPEPPDPDLDMVFPMDSPVLVPSDPPLVLRLKLTAPYHRWGPSLMDLNSRPPDPPDRATLSHSKTFTIITIEQLFPHLELALVDPKNFLVISVSHSRLTRAGSSVISLPCSILSIIHVSPSPPSRAFKLGLKRYPEDPCHQPPQTYFPSQKVVDLVSDVGGNPLRHPSLNHGFMNLASDVGGNPLRRSALSHLFVNLVSDVGGNPLRRPAMSHQKLVRPCCRCTTFTSSSIVESTSIPCLLSMNGENFSDSFSSFSFSLLTGLLPCGAVCTGPEGAIEITSGFLVGEDCLSTSLVNISQLSDFVVEALSTHSNLVLNLLSTSYEDLSCLFLLAIVVYKLFSRGGLIPSWLCNP